MAPVGRYDLSVLYVRRGPNRGRGRDTAVVVLLCNRYFQC